MTYERHRHSSDTSYERGTEKALAIVADSSFKGIITTTTMITALFLSMLVATVVNVVFSLNLCGSAHRLF